MTRRTHLPKSEPRTGPATSHYRSVRGHFPLVLSGNRNTAVGTLSGLTPARRATFWFDAHGDCNTPETTTSGFLDGMGLAMTMGLCWHHLGALPHLTAAIAIVRARVPLGAAALTSYSPEDEHDQSVCRAAFAAIDAIVANGA